MNKYKVLCEADVINLDITRVDRKKITSYIDSELPFHQLNTDSGRSAVGFMIKASISQNHLILGEVEITNIIPR